MDEYDFKETPERRAEIARLHRLHDAASGGGRAMLPPTGLTWLWMKYHQEDKLEAEFALPIPKFDWVISDDSGTAAGMQRVSGISTLIEAVSRAADIWRAAGYAVVGQLHADRSDGKRFD